jgi:hypothetical protein
MPTTNHHNQLIHITTCHHLIATAENTHIPLKMSNATTSWSPTPEPWGINPFTRKARNYPTEISKRKGLGLNQLTLKPRREFRPEEPEESFVHPHCTRPLEVPPVSSPVSALKATAETPIPTGMVFPKTVSSALRPHQNTKSRTVKYAGTAFDTSEPTLVP